MVTRMILMSVVVVVVVDSHVLRIALATEETTVTQQVSHRPIKCQSRLWSQRRGTNVSECLTITNRDHRRQLSYHYYTCGDMFAESNGGSKHAFLPLLYISFTRDEQLLQNSLLSIQ